MEEMFIGTNSNGLVIGDANVLSRAVPQDQESRDMIVNQMVSAAEATPYVETVEETVADPVMFSAAPETEFCM